MDDLEQFMIELEEESKKKNFRNWLNNKFPKGFGGYNAYHLLLHPLKFFDHIANEIKWAWQRVFRGFDDRVAWSIDYHLAKTIPQYVKLLKENKIGIPMSVLSDFPHDENYNCSDKDWKLAQEKWNKILEDIAEGFEAYIGLDDLWGEEHQEERKLKEDKFNKAFELLKENFSDLWD
jgi:hypothetical protein